MPSTFFGLDIGKTGLYAASVGLNTAAHNISNENTKGYSRQQINQQARQAADVYARYGQVGTGVEVTSIERVRDKYYDSKYRYNNAKQNEQSAKYTYNLQIEDYFNEMKEEGFTTQYNNIFSAFQELNGSPEDITIRTEVLNYAQSMADYMNDVQTKLTKLQQESNLDVSNCVDRINTYTDQIATLTKQINTVELAGGTANDLRDQRDLVLDKLSAMVPVDVTETKYGENKVDYIVKAGEFVLVNNNDNRELTVVSRETKNNNYDVVGLYDIYYYYDEETKSGTRFDVQAMNLGGQLRGTLDIRDGNNADTSSGKEINYKGIPYYINKIQNFKQAIADAFNSVQTSGINLYGDSSADTDFFTITSTGRLEVNKELMKDPMLLATTDKPLHEGVADASLVSKYLDIRDAKILDNNSATQYLEGIVGEIGVSTQKAKVFLSNYENIVQTIDTQRMSISGVDSDEETMSLQKYQEAYSLCSKIITVMAQCYDKLINETGV